jgi:hypothetical protein
LQTHGAKLAAFIAGLTAAEESEIRDQIAALADLLELIDSADLIARADDNSLRVALRVTTARPLKPIKK